MWSARTSWKLEGSIQSANSGSGNSTTGAGLRPQRLPAGNGVDTGRLVERARPGATFEDDIDGKIRDPGGCLFG